MALPALGTDLFVPALPALASSLGAPVSAGQFTLTTYFAGLAAGMLFWGPLSDRFGRRPVVLAGLSFAVVASLAAIATSSIGALIAVRSAYWRRAWLLVLISGRYNRRPNTVST